MSGAFGFWLVKLWETFEVKKPSASTTNFKFNKVVKLASRGL